ncbi:hypothetical protein CFP56_005405 [Quercus suber]|uniref:Uncharacterized protein n=1 Tax=Quercus suber TaxID=58331 RepID=A0AAW0LAV8_QUESU
MHSGIVNIITDYILANFGFTDRDGWPELGDVESISCLALRYEALHMRELKSTSCQWLEVSYLEWLNFAEHS